MPSTAASADQATSPPGTPVPLTAIAMPSAARPKGWEAAITSSTGITRDLTPPRKSPTPQLRLALSASRAAPKPVGLVGYGARGGYGVELVRVIEDGRFRGSRGAEIVVDRDRVQELGAYLGLESRGSLLDQAQAEMDVAE